eukprot:CAMPEP_0201540012 /NCGR_PEP_ID=MMETSP0161_2-20130828/70716_1 /ASSEMBLY_ACC=CAM_ASM_000251 /TAXON_ID=180227 /ORGANISM="Neoparamoeba aestuarina, Strain SoJaBio B1-5/56/2" /LENGTH=107 /DNA_ID=CAMNT_0047947449 /DNA_START=17 /DNA_END=340 /DNA_ORIENTATION=+
MALSRAFLSSSILPHGRALAARSLSTSTPRLGAPAEEEVTEPQGILFGKKPGEMWAWEHLENWELIWYAGMGGSLFAGFLLFTYRDEPISSEDWLKEEIKYRKDTRL